MSIEYYATVPSEKNLAVGILPKPTLPNELALSFSCPIKNIERKSNTGNFFILMASSV